MTTQDGVTEPVGARGRSVASVIVALRELILDRELLPGEQIRQEEMARTLGVSRVPLREALRVLTAEGLLVHRPHQGYRVAQLNRQGLEQIHTLLEFLETELLRTARWPDAEEIRRMRQLDRQMAEAAAAGDVGEVNRLNRELHLSIFRLSPMEIYLAEVERFWALSEPYRLLHVATTDPAVAIEQHEQIIDAMEARDRALCLRVLSRHRQDTQQAVLEVLGRLRDSEGSGDGFPAISGDRLTG